MIDVIGDNIEDVYTLFRVEIKRSIFKPHTLFLIYSKFKPLNSFITLADVIDLGLLKLTHCR
jgi:hypothetical protein